MLKLIDHNETHYDSERKIWSGPAYRPYYDRNCSFGYIAFEELRRRPSHVCQISDSENTRLTNEEVRLQAIRIARSFEKLGIRQSDIIGICGRNTTYLFAVTLACFFHGSAYQSTSPIHDKRTVKGLYEITKPKLIFCDGQDLEKIRYATSAFKTKIFTLKNHIEGVPSVLDLLKPTEDEHLYRPAELEKGTTQNLAILCSSGTTGPPKAVTISHLHRIWEVSNFLTADDIQLMISTMDWLSSLVMIVNSIIYGAARVISDKPFTAEYFLEVVEKYKTTFTINSPPSMAAIIKSSNTTPMKLDSIRYFMFGGSKTSLTVQHAIQNFLRNGRIIQAYGFTELNSSLVRNFNFTEKPDSSGILLPGYKARIVNENGQNVGPNEIGEVLCHSGENWAGYYNNVEATNSMYDKDGWLHTGDLGYFDGDNYLYITERKKNLLKYNHMQYYPSDIEEVLAQIPDVKEVCVFGIQNELHGDMAAAAVVKVEGSSLTPEDIISYMRQQIEADYMQLHGGCKFLEEIPKTSSGKIDRKTAKVNFLKK